MPCRVGSAHNFAQRKCVCVCVCGGGGVSTKERAGREGQTRVRLHPKRKRPLPRSPLMTNKEKTCSSMVDRHSRHGVSSSFRVDKRISKKREEERGREGASEMAGWRRGKTERGESVEREGGRGVQLLSNLISKEPRHSVLETRAINFILVPK